MNGTATTRSRLVALLALPLLSGIVLTACKDDPADPGDFPITFTAEEVEDVSDVKVFANNGSAWVEVPEGSTDLFDDSIFAASAQIQDDDSGFVVISDTQWRLGLLPDSTFTYTRDDDRITFLMAIEGSTMNIFADGNLSEFKTHNVTYINVFDDGSTRVATGISGLSYDPDLDVLEQIADSDADTVAYQTFKIEYDAED